MTTTVGPFGKIIKLGEDAFAVSIWEYVNGKPKINVQGSEKTEEDCQTWIEWTLPFQRIHPALSAPNTHMKMLFRKYDEGGGLHREVVQAEKPI